MNGIHDKAGEEYWTENWSALAMPALIDLENRSLKNENNLRYDAFFSDLFAGINVRGRRLLEVGCARSVWLPYFATRHGMDVCGLDYSEEGCRQEEAVLRMAGVQAPVIHGDLFDVHSSLLGRFDYVVTFGVVEHFTDTVNCIRSLAKYLRPGGTIVTMVPNMCGAVGVVQRLLDRRVFDTHLLLDASELSAAHSAAELTVVSCDYFMFSDFYVVNIANRSHERIYPALRLIYGALGRLSMATWVLERMTCKFSTSRLMSPYLMCVAQKPL